MAVGSKNGDGSQIEFELPQIDICNLKNQTIGVRFTT
jgi:hypothetical protein